MHEKNEKNDVDSLYNLKFHHLYPGLAAVNVQIRILVAILDY